MTRPAGKSLGCLLAGLGVAVAVGLTPFQGIIWDGGFESTEFRLTFVDKTGKPVPGVTLRVLTRAGGPCHLYPIDEFLPDQTPTSDDEGRMLFHHAGTGLEFGGHEYYNLVGMRFGETTSPQYVCVFSAAGRELYRSRYTELCVRGEWDHLPKVRRPWPDPEWPAREILRADGDPSNLRMRLYDGNGDGYLDREERTAAGYFARVAERSLSKHEQRDIQFVISEQTITVPTP